MADVSKRPEVSETIFGVFLLAFPVEDEEFLAPGLVIDYLMVSPAGQLTLPAQSISFQEVKILRLMAGLLLCDKQPNGGRSPLEEKLRYLSWHQIYQIGC